ncbi:MAG: glutamyl-tRNA reductase [Lachnospiraceae bacterium]|nr:glutamyl-tRNA reductase [Lachnospiraceae bacterium]
MECISINHKTAKSSDRQRCFVPKEEMKDFLKEIMNLDKVEQCVLLSTCNRTEIYVQGEENCFKELQELMAKTAGNDGQWIKSLSRRYQGRKAILHLFRVVCGMESMVIGEDEILGQVRDAYMCSMEAGYTGCELNSVFQAALACAKRVKSDTMISKSSVSVATLAANEVFHLSIPQKTVLLIGSSGQMGGIILKNLLSQENIRVIATVRSHNGIYQSGNPRVENVDYQNRYDYLNEADVVISATSSPHYTLMAEKVKSSIITPKERLFLDISMPPDIDENIAGIECCRLISLDDINRLAEENNRRKEQALMDAEEILEEDLDMICKVLAFHRFTEAEAGWKERYGGWTAEKLIYLLRDELDSDSFEAVLRVLRCVD